jgi:hypothetical protein
MPQVPLNYGSKSPVASQNGTGIFISFQYHLESRYRVYCAGGYWSRLDRRRALLVAVYDVGSSTA